VDPFGVISLGIREGTITAFDNTNQASLGSAAYDATRMRFLRWRVDEDGYRLNGEVSADRVVWSWIGSRQLTGRRARFAQTTLGAGALVENAPPSQVVFESFNFCD
jgi:hypothetical protein